jgi:hypothetical protein
MELFSVGAGVLVGGDTNTMAGEEVQAVIMNRRQHDRIILMDRANVFFADLFIIGTTPLTVNCSTYKGKDPTSV